MCGVCALRANHSLVCSPSSPVAPGSRLLLSPSPSPPRYPPARRPIAFRSSSSPLSIARAARSPRRRHLPHRRAHLPGEHCVAATSAFASSSSPPGFAAPGSSPSASAFSASPSSSSSSSSSRIMFASTLVTYSSRSANARCLVSSIASCAGCRTCRTASTARRRRGPCGPCGRPRGELGVDDLAGGLAPAQAVAPHLGAMAVCSFKAKSQQSARCHSQPVRAGQFTFAAISVNDAQLVSQRKRENTPLLMPNSHANQPYLLSFVSVELPEPAERPLVIGRDRLSVSWREPGGESFFRPISGARTAVRRPIDSSSAAFVTARSSHRPDTRRDAGRTRRKRPPHPARDRRTRYHVVRREVMAGSPKAGFPRAGPAGCSARSRW